METERTTEETDAIYDLTSLLFDCFRQREGAPPTKKFVKQIRKFSKRYLKIQLTDEEVDNVF